MGRFAGVGRRLRALRFLGILCIGVSLVTVGVLVSDALSGWPPTRWVSQRAPESGITRNITVRMSPDDPEYERIWSLRMRDLSIAAGWGMAGIGVGMFFYYLSRRPPTTTVLRLAQESNGLLTLPDVAIALNIDPHLAAKSLKDLQKLNIATPRWQEYRKNLWEFPDYVKLPMDQALEIARHSGGRITLKDLLAQGHSLDTAQQTMDALARQGLADAVSQERAAPEARPMAAAAQ